jgi:peptidyl-Lys metalloendopeptidase
MQTKAAALAACRPWRLVTPLLLLAFVLAGCAASAQAPQAQGRAQAPLVIPEGCDAKQAGLVREAFTLAERQTGQALAFLAANPTHPHTRTWFGTGSVAKVEARLRLTQYMLHPSRHPAWTCGTVESCGNRTTFAIANLRQGLIMLCPPFFNASNEGGDSRPGILVHEVSHLVAQTNDVAYGQQAARQLAEKDPERAIRNADNFEYFVEFLPR